MNFKVCMILMFFLLNKSIYANSEGTGRSGLSSNDPLGNMNMDALVWSLEDPFVSSNQGDIKKYSDAIRARIQRAQNGWDAKSPDQGVKLAKDFLECLNKLLMNDTFRILPKVKILNTDALPSADAMAPFWNILTPQEWNMYFENAIVNIAADKDKYPLGFMQVSNVFLSYIDYLEKFKPEELAKLHENAQLKWAIKLCHQKYLSSTNEVSEKNLESLTKLHMATTSFLGDVSMSDNSYHYFLKEMITAYPQAFNHIMQRAAKSPAAQVNLTSFQPFNPNIGKWNNFASEGKLVQGSHSPVHKGLEPIVDKNEPK